MDLIDTFFNARVLRETLPLLLEGLWVTRLLGATAISQSSSGLALGGGLLSAGRRSVSANPSALPTSNQVSIPVIHGSRIGVVDKPGTSWRPEMANTSPRYAPSVASVAK